LRILASVVLIGLALATAYAGGLVFSGWVALVGALMAYEWHTIAFGQGRRVMFGLHIAAFALVIAASMTGRFGVGLLAIVVAILLALVLVRIQKLRPPWAVIGLPYTLLPCLSLLWLRQTAVAPLATVIWLYALVWASDIGALVVGKSLGGLKLAPSISPHKTWAGLLGAVVAAGLVGYATGYMVEGTSKLMLAGLSGLLAVVSQVGDLTESAFKRRFGVKDSSQLIPGQGGVLDRVDGLIFATLAVAALALFRSGSVLFLEGWQ
jgi:phosphatidate cytidylyltransferase